MDSIEQRSRHLPVYIGHEVGGENVADVRFTTLCTSVQKMRPVGIRTPLVIDDPDCGKRFTGMDVTAHGHLAADPDHNPISLDHQNRPANHDAAPKVIKSSSDGSTANSRIATSAESLPRRRRNPPRPCPQKANAGTSCPRSFGERRLRQARALADIADRWRNVASRLNQEPDRVQITCRRPGAKTAQ